MSEKPWASWHLIYNLDGTFRGYEWALDADGNQRPSVVYAQEGRDQDGKPLAGTPSEDA
jgi:hypothetical protein